MADIQAMSKLAEFGILGIVLTVVMVAFWQVLRTLIKQYQDEREHYWKGADERYATLSRILADFCEKSDVRHVEIMKRLWQMNGHREE